MGTGTFLSWEGTQKRKNDAKIAETLKKNIKIKLEYWF
jgi:hypothetical protein